MKTSVVFAAAVLLTAGLSSVTFAQPVSSPSPANPAPAPDQVIYASRLPSAAELSNAAAAQNQKIDKIEQTNTEVRVIYNDTNRQSRTVSYQLLPAADPSAPVVVPTSPAPVVTTTVPATVIYEPTVRRVYYYPGYYPWGWYAPVSVRFGVGFGFPHHGFHGGFHGGWRH